jgi:hypothetical protein
VRHIHWLTKDEIVSTNCAKVTDTATGDRQWTITFPDFDGEGGITDIEIDSQDQRALVGLNDRIYEVALSTKSFKDLRADPQSPGADLVRPQREEDSVSLQNH